ncbi:pyridoxamine 5'-phosphate oxidase family protein [Candidatus Bathyarchaeota archaeon]|nr:MAG: pyridoxamine 5'-phosphate oxidase family protein [Candidatus Bathyarchaeota archaeon]
MSYKQPPNLTEDEIYEFINKAKIARICTHNKDGSIHAVPVWYTYINNEFHIGTAIGGKRCARSKAKINPKTAYLDQKKVTKSVTVTGKTVHKTRLVNTLRYFKQVLRHQNIPENHILLNRNHLFHRRQYLIHIQNRPIYIIPLHMRLTELINPPLKLRQNRPQMTLNLITPTQTTQLPLKTPLLHTIKLRIA